MRCRAATAGLLLALLACGEVAPLGKRPQSDQFLTMERLTAIAAPGSTQVSILERWGAPLVASRDGRAMAYLALTTVDRTILTLAVVIPFWQETSVTYFQVRGIWFDAEGKVIQTRLWEGHNGPYGGNPYGSYALPTQAHVLRWLQDNTPGAAGR